MVSAVLFITFFVLLVLNVPISVCLGLLNLKCADCDLPWTFFRMCNLIFGNFFNNCSNKYVFRNQ